MQILQQHTASREKRPNFITFSEGIKSKFEIVEKFNSSAHLILKFEGILFPMFGREFIGFGQRGGISPIWQANASANHGEVWNQTY